ncbi:alpha-glucosidase/oligosaccharide 4-alpha-D-glucosyltransferase [Lutibacter oricola]|uniref:Alpha-glucosidase/oligosaccharide 4-alpha-D-glucosyltransferase n=1 Tax=Lutibacter oricola TaxID=762486 RepID=A0A1H3GGL7_9FLAO|nr:TIM-barrel domain-containing protein [Lutibacter oricola]SDY02512.1 alpha-glucosidase/oligosaccharide 4-alpha-D-glucosyltransferase [Lutibacter oricola]
MKSLKLTILLFIFSTIFYAQNPNRKLEKVTKFKSYVEVKTNDGVYRFQPYGNEIIETSFIPKGETFNPNSHAVVLKPEAVEMEIVETSGMTEIKMKDISVKINHSPFQVSYYYEDNFLISEKKGYYKVPHNPMELVKGNIVAKETESIEFNLTEDEVLYGGGARALGMNRRGNRLPLYNRAHYGYETHSELMNFTLPVMYSSKMYAIHFDNAPIGYLDFDSKKNNTLTYETISGRKTYQVIAGDDWEEVVENYVALTGFQPLIPRWALGNFSSRFGYHSQKETIETINEFQKEEIPVDAIILDLYWFGKEVQGTMGNLKFDRDSFPNPKKMVADLKEKGVKTILITEPFVLTTSNRWDEAVKEDILGKTKEGKPYTYDFYFGNTAIIDIFSPKGNEWFWNIYKDLKNEYGIEGWWGDLGEPEVHPSDLLHATGTADEVHNIYGSEWAKLIAKGYEKEFPNERPFILMRAGYSGAQHYGMIPWSGDVNRTWGGLKPQMEISLQMGMQGLAYMHSDLGGFAGPNLDDELYTRWLQYGVFQPIYRPHAQEDVPSEPVFREEKTKQLAKEAIELRYSLLSYNYNLAFENSKKGAPLMRPLFFEDESLNEVDKTYLWGDSFLVSPVISAGIKEQEVVFPKGSNWYNFYTEEKVDGGQTKTVQLKEENIPTYVRGGSFIPMIQPIQNTSTYNLDKFDLHFYYEEGIDEVDYSLYNDDGETKDAFEKGMYEILAFEAEQEKRWFEIDFEAETGENYQTSTKEIKLIIHNVNKVPKRVKINGKRRMFYLENHGKNIVIPVTWNTSEEKSIRIKF